MPSASKAQHNLMAMVANNPAAAKRTGIPQSVGSEFMKADKGRKFSKGGATMAESMKAKELRHASTLRKLAKEEAAEAKEYKRGGVARTVTKEMEYDYKTGKKSFAGSTAKKDAHAEKEGKIVAKHAAYDKDMDGMKCGGKVKKMAAGGKTNAQMLKYGRNMAKVVNQRGSARGK